MDIGWSLGPEYRLYAHSVTCPRALSVIYGQLPPRDIQAEQPPPRTGIPVGACWLAPGRAGAEHPPQSTAADGMGVVEPWVRRRAGRLASCGARVELR